ncbi:MAG: winged helix-turn-helix transcriptional regulator [Desulfobacter sp.]|nr:MAG: winged helix-turn-helix transcriptional regulator [Desulfobacter sp.]
MDVCSGKCINPEQVSNTVDRLPSDAIIAGMAEIFKALGDPSRLKIVNALLVREHCVCDLAAICSQSESAVSHQLRILRTLKVVKNRREGKIIYYSLDDDHVRSLIRMSRDHIAHQPDI